MKSVVGLVVGSCLHRDASCLATLTVTARLTALLLQYGFVPMSPAGSEHTDWIQASTEVRMAPANSPLLL